MGFFEALVAIFALAVFLFIQMLPAILLILGIATVIFLLSTSKDELRKEDTDG